MKYQSLPKNLSIKSRNQKQAEQTLWNTFLRPVDQSMPEHSFHCECQMCKQYQHKKFKQNLEQQTKIINNKIRNRVTTSNSVRQQAIQHNYQWVLKRLMIPHNKIATTALNIYITETLFFKDGEAVQFYLSKQIQDPIFKKIPKQKLNNAFIQKVMSDRRRKYKDYIRIKTGRKKLQQKKKLLFGQKQVRKQIKDAVLIRYNDGYEQLLTQNQFLTISLRRKQDPIWKQILSIRNFINITNPQQQNSAYVVIKFDRNKINYQKMFQRTKTLMKVYGQYITADDNKYISQQDQSKFAKNLQNTNLKLYAEYLVYQIVSYIQYFYDEQVDLIVAGIYFDQIGHAFLNQVIKLQVESLIKFQWTNQIYRKRMDQQQAKILTVKQIVNSPDNQKRATGIIAVMHQAYQKMRDRLGLNMQDEDDKEQVANNNFFKTLHPGFNQNISDVLKDGNLTLSQFKKVYLGFKQKKKPIIKQFTSNMIRTIHLTSPKLNTTNPHSYIASPSKNKTINDSQRKRDTIILSPLKLDFHRKLYETLPVKKTN